MVSSENNVRSSTDVSVGMRQQSLRTMETRIDNGQSGRDPHPENDSNLANFHFISSLSRRHDMSASEVLHHVTNVTRHLQSGDNL